MTVQVQVVVRRLKANNLVIGADSIDDAKRLLAQVVAQGQPDVAAIEVERVTSDRVGLVFPDPTEGATWLDQKLMNEELPGAEGARRPGISLSQGSKGSFIAPTDLAFQLVSHMDDDQVQTVKVSARNLNNALASMAKDGNCRQIEIFRVVTEHLGIRTPDGREFWNDQLIRRPIIERKGRGAVGFEVA